MNVEEGGRGGGGGGGSKANRWVDRRIWRDEGESQKLASPPFHPPFPSNIKKGQAGPRRGEAFTNTEDGGRG